MQARPSPKARGALDAGYAHAQAGRMTQAAAMFRAAIRHAPRWAEPHRALADILTAEKDHPAAVTALQTAVRLEPSAAEGWNGLGLALLRVKQPAEAEAAFRTALDLAADSPELRVNLALARADQKDAAGAREALFKAAELAGENGAALAIVAKVAVTLKHYAELLPYLERYVRRVDEPELEIARAVTVCNLQLARPEPALAAARAAVRLYPDDLDVQSDYAVALDLSGDHAGCDMVAQRILRRQPDSVEGRYLAGFSQLVRGLMGPAVWRGMNARWERADAVRRSAAPQWEGGPREGRSLLILADEGFGDTILMARYMPLLRDGDGPVLWEAAKPMERLLARVPGAPPIVPKEPLAPHDLCCPVMGLPLAFGTTRETLPTATPYVFAEPAAVAAWRARLAMQPGRTVGVAWAGNTDMPLDRLRSLPPEMLAALDGIPNVRFVSLQVPRPARPPPLPMTDWTDELTDFAATADLIAALDLVVSVDTAVVNLAAALDAPTWLLNRFAPDWRWPPGLTESPWYPKVRQFRQPKLHDWDSVMRDVRAALTAWAA